MAQEADTDKSDFRLLLTKVQSIDEMKMDIPVLQ